MESTAIIALIYAVGTLFVIISAVRFFNDPPMEPSDRKVKNILHSEPAIDPVIPKYVTERTRYHLYLSAFICITLALYFIMSLVFPVLVTKVIDKDINIPFSVALVIGTLAFINFSKKLPFVYDTLSNWKEDLHKRAKIPDNALYVFDCLQSNEANKSTEAFQTNLAEILTSEVDNKKRTDIEKEDFYFDKHRIERKWARLTYLVHCLDKWDKERQFSRHLKTESLRWRPLRSYYFDTLYPQMLKYKNGELNENAVEQLKEKVSSALIKVYWLITLLLFMANRSSEDPCVHLKNIGWVVSPDKYFKFSYRHILFTGFVVFISILVGAAVGSMVTLMLSDVLPDKYSIGPKDIQRWLSYGTLMFIIPLFVCLSIKRFLTIHDMWSVRRPEQAREPFSKRPWEVYVPVSLISYAASILILGTMASLFEPGSIKDIFYKLSIYSGMSFISSMFICYLIDTPTPGWEKDPMFYIKSLPVGMIFGALNVLLLVYAALLFSDLNHFRFWELPDEAKGKLVVQGVTAFVIGISMYMTSRLGSKHYERRENDIERSTDGWWTVTIDNFQKRVQACSNSPRQFEILADDELKTIADIGDRVKMVNINQTISGEVAKVEDNRIQIAVLA